MEDITKFEENIKELIQSIQSDFCSEENNSPECFISYCWKNSKRARNKDSIYSDDAIGNLDPRELKEKIEEAGVRCWLDIEQVGRVGLYQDIARGLQKCKVFVCCLSDEYVVSKNCKMEFRFAALNLKLPVIVVIVGNGVNWLKFEIGILAQGYQTYLMKDIVKDLKTMINLVFDKTQPKNNGEQFTSKNELSKKKHFFQLLELTQRKFLNFIKLLIDSKIKKRHFPSLLVIDFLTTGTVNQSYTHKLNGLSFFFLCEHDEGWHIPENMKRIPWSFYWSNSKAENQLKKWSIYLLKLFLILKEIDLPLAILNTEKGLSYVEKIIDYDESVEKYSTESNIVENFVSIIDFIETITKEKIEFESYLTNCLLPTGNSSWLCDKHKHNLSEQSYQQSNEYKDNPIKRTSYTGQNTQWLIREDLSEKNDSQEKETLLRNEKLRKEFFGNLTSKNSRPKSRACILS